MGDFRLLLPDNRGILGSVDDQGILSFVITAGPGCPIRGTEMFDLMVRAFGASVRAINGVWRAGFAGQPSTNLDRVNELTAAGMLLEDAVLHTWTVTRAARWGFNTVSILGTPVGPAGSYRKIDVLIEQSGRTP